MTDLLYILIGISLGSVLVYFITRSRRRASGLDVSQNITQELQRLREELQRTNNDHRKEMQGQLQRVEDQLGKGMRHSHESMQKQFEQTLQSAQAIAKELSEVKNVNKQVLDFSSQLQNLQNILKNPKQRGVLGEYWLETLLGNVLPATSYKMQYDVGTDEKTSQKLIADAAIFIRDQVIPIDAKFTLENYNRMMQEQDAPRREKIERDFKADVKKRIDETSKYIRPELGTMNFAFMFIPAEGVYYNLLNAEVGSGINSSNLVQYAFEKHVMLVSPTSFYAYLQTVLLGLRELQLEESTTEIIKRVGELGKHFSAYADYHEKLGNNLTTVVNQYNKSGSELRKVSKDVNKITSGDMDILELDEVHKPAIE